MSGFHHEALFYETHDDFLGALVPFVRDGIAAGEPVMVALAQPRLELLQEAVDAPSATVRFVDMGVMGCNPARIIPAWRDFADGHPGRALRGIGEPAWPGRSDAELIECGSHESLLNLAFAGAPAFQLVCPYDAVKLPAAVLERARHNHPWITHEGTCDDYLAPDAQPGPFDGLLPPPRQAGHEVAFTIEDLGTVRTFVASIAGQAGLSPHRTADLVLAVNELATNTVRHAGGVGSLRAWRENGSLICEVDDDGWIAEPLAGRQMPAGEQPSGRGLWLVNHLCDLVQIRSRDGASVIRLHMHI